MKVIINKGKMEIDTNELLLNLDEDNLIKLADTLSCQDLVIKNVSDQIIDGCTDVGSSGSEGVDSIHFTPLENARRRVAMKAGDVAKREIETLQRRLESAKRRMKNKEDWAWAMYHAWPDEYLRARPDIEAFEKGGA